MAISLTCACGKRLQAKDELAGKRVKCPACGHGLVIPIPEDIATQELRSQPPVESKPSKTADSGDLGYGLQPEERFDKEPQRRPRPTPRKLKPAESFPKKVALPVAPSRTFERYQLHWLLVLALIPLAFSLLQKEENDSFGDRVSQTLAKYPPKERARLEMEIESRIAARLKNSEVPTKDDVLSVLPEGRLHGAHLARKTWMHWAYAGLSIVLFFGFLLLISPPKDFNPLTLLGIGLFTGTIGILFLLVVQLLADWTQGVWLTGRSVVVIFFYIAKFIGFSYSAAEDPESNWLLSFLGFTCGVGFCEELCKASPLLLHYRRGPTLGWRGAFLWGMASGAGFGVSEGIMYSSDSYNGVSPAGIYVVRFISCVALHALWSGSVGITLDKCRDLLRGDMHWYEFIAPLVRILGVAMILHGLYDTTLKKEMNAFALLVAVASFLWLAWQILRMGADREVAPAGKRR